MTKDSRLLIYLSIMTLVFSCVGLGYGFLFFGWAFDYGSSAVTISPGYIIVAGLVFSAVNGVASGVISNQLTRKVNTLPKYLQVAVPSSVFFITLVLSIMIALIRM